MYTDSDITSSISILKIGGVLNKHAGRIVSQALGQDFKASSRTLGLGPSSRNPHLGSLGRTCDQ